MKYYNDGFSFGKYNQSNFIVKIIEMDNKKLSKNQRKLKIWMLGYLAGLAEQGEYCTTTVRNELFAQGINEEKANFLVTIAYEAIINAKTFIRLPILQLK
jgi:hypothetical protein